MNYPSSEFDQAVAMLCHGTISDKTLGELHELLRINVEAQDEYLWRVEIHGELASGRLDFRGGDTVQETDRVAVTPVSTPPRNMFSGWRKFASAFAAALLVMSVLGGSALLLRNSRSNNPVPEEAVARFTELEDSRWMNSTTDVVSDDVVRKGQRIELSSGTAKVQFNSGALLTMTGSTIIEPLSENSAFLMLGELSVVAETPESRGFTLVTQNSKFVDIGTAFTASVAPDGLSRLEVSEGEVDVVLKGVKVAQRLRAGESILVEPGARQVTTRIERGDGTAAFRFATIEPPSREDYADRTRGRATIRVAHGELKGAAVEVLVDGVGQSHPDSPQESAFFDSRRGGLLVDLGKNISITRINSYSWHQHETIEEHRNRAQQRFTLYGFSGDDLPDTTLRPEDAGWTRIARVNSDQFFEVRESLDRPSQQACSITEPNGEVGRYRYLLWEVRRGTFYGEIDVYGPPSANEQASEEL